LLAVGRQEAIMSRGERKSLVWDIRNSLLTLSAGELLQIARAVEPVSGEDQAELVEGDEEGCYDYINSFMYSKQLLDTEDEGMVQLLILKDTIDDVVKCRDDDDVSMSNVEGDSELHTVQGRGKLDDRVDFMESSVITQTAPENTTDTFRQSHHRFNVGRAASPSDIAALDSGPKAPAMLNTPDTANTELLKVLASYEEISKKLVQCLPTPAVPPQTQLTQSSGILQQPDRKPPSELTSQSAREGVASLSGVPTCHGESSKCKADRSVTNLQTSVITMSVDKLMMESKKDFQIQKLFVVC